MFWKLVREFDLDDLRWLVVATLVVSVAYFADATWQLERQVRELRVDQWDAVTRCIDHQRRLEDLELEKLEDARDANGWGSGSMVPDDCTPVAPVQYIAPESVPCIVPLGHVDLGHNSAKVTLEYTGPLPAALSDCGW